MFLNYSKPIIIILFVSNIPISGLYCTLGCVISIPPSGKLVEVISINCRIDFLNRIIPMPIPILLMVFLRMEIVIVVQKFYGLSDV